MKIDTHIHGEFSSDSTNKYEEIIQKAISLHYHYICFTEHMDLVPYEIVNYGILPLRKYFNRIDSLKNRYKNKLHIGFGIELGESHLTLDQANELFNYIQPEFIIGSLHLLKNLKNLSTPINFSLQENIIMQYYQEVEEIVMKGGIDSLGHLGIFKREVSDQTQCKDDNYLDQISKILKIMISKNIALEVNYSGFRSNFKMHLPGIDIIKLYYDMGGTLITLGSDTHHIDQFDNYYNQTIKNIRHSGFKYLSYKHNGCWDQMKIEGV